jgi:ABC-type glycerol-3-phosphate transport system permease component
MTTNVDRKRPSNRQLQASTMAREGGPGAVIKRVLGYAVLIFFALVFIMPFVLSAATAFKTLPDIQANPTSLVADPAFGGWTTEGIET